MITTTFLTFMNLASGIIELLNPILTAVTFIGLVGVLYSLVMLYVSKNKDTEVVKKYKKILLLSALLFISAVIVGYIPYVYHDLLYPQLAGHF